jgi:hypothetical protein
MITPRQRRPIFALRPRAIDRLLLNPECAEHLPGSLENAMRRLPMRFPVPFSGVEWLLKPLADMTANR